MTDVHASWPRLVADIGGTHARFALETAPQRLTHIEVLAVGDHSSVLDVVRAYLARVGQPPLRHAALAVAAPIGGDWVQMSNHDWAFSIDATRRALHLETLIGLNDCAAQAWAVPHLNAAKLVQVGGGEPCPVAPKAIIGPGTGLGVSALLSAGSSFMVLAGEGGHVSFAPFDDTEMYLWQYARQKYGHVSAERLLSGAGLSLIYQALAAREQKALPALGAAQISARALSGHAPLARQSVDIFYAMLGTVAANLALTLGARGGVYLCGGILPRLVDDFKTSLFRHRFDNKGRFSAYLADIPVYVVLDAQAGLLGVAAALAAYLHLAA